MTIIKNRLHNIFAMKHAKIVARSIMFLDFTVHLFTLYANAMKTSEKWLRVKAYVGRKTYPSFAIYRTDDSF